MKVYKRTLIKAVTWEMSGMAMLCAIAYAQTGSWWQGSIFSIGYTVLRVIMYYFHSRLWKRIKWGKNIGDNEPTEFHT